MVLYASYYGALLLRYWDIKSGSETQLRLERRTYLISTIIGYALVFQLFSFFLFIYTADALHPFFTGAMCAVGSLNVNQWGFSLIIFRIITFLLAAPGHGDFILCGHDRDSRFGGGVLSHRSHGLRVCGGGFRHPGGLHRRGHL